MARFDYKTGTGGSVMPFQLLDDAADEDGDTWRERSRLWVEYVVATKGRRAITWSRGLLDLVGIEDTRTDQEIIDDTAAAPLRLVIPGRVYDVARVHGVVLALLLEAVEARDLTRVRALLHCSTSADWVAEWWEAFEPVPAAPVVVDVSDVVPSVASAPGPLYLGKVAARLHELDCAATGFDGSVLVSAGPVLGHMGELSP
jgi:hypothetical protein